MHELCTEYFSETVIPQGYFFRGRLGSWWDCTGQGFINPNISQEPTCSSTQASSTTLFVNEMAVTVRWSTRATQTRALKYPQGADLRVPSSFLPVLRWENKIYRMWRLETVMSLNFLTAQEKKGWNSLLAAKRGRNFNSSLFFGHYCIYSITSLSSLSVLQYIQKLNSKLNSVDVVCWTVPI